MSDMKVQRVALAIKRAVEQRSYATLLDQARKLPRVHGLPKEVVVYGYMNICELAGERHDLVNLFLYADKLFRLENRPVVLISLAETIYSALSDCPDELAVEAAQRLGQFAAACLTPTYLAKATVQETESWLSLTLTPVIYGSIDLFSRLSVAYLEKAKGRPDIGFSPIILPFFAAIRNNRLIPDAAAARPFAEHLVNEFDRFASQNRQVRGNEIDVLLLEQYLSLLRLGFADLAESFLGRALPFLNEQTVVLIGIAQKMRTDFPAGQLAASKFLQEEKPPSKRCLDALNNFALFAYKVFLEAHPEKLVNCRAIRSFSNLTREKAPDLAAQISDTRLKLIRDNLPALLNFANRGALQTYPSAFFYSENEGRLVHYYSRFGGPYKVSYEVVKDGTGKIVDIKPEPILHQVSSAELESVPVISDLCEVESLAELVVILNPNLAPTLNKVLKPLRHELIRREMIEINKQLEIFFQEVQKVFSCTSAYQTNLPELHNRLRLCQALVGKFSRPVEEEYKYPLAPTDFLFPFIRSLNIYSREQSRQFLESSLPEMTTAADPADQRFPLIVYMHLRDGKEIAAVVRSPSEIVFQGAMVDINEDFRNYLLELVLETIIKSQFPEALPSRPALPAETEGTTTVGTDSDPQAFNPAVQERIFTGLSNTYRRLFYDQIRGKGLRHFDWYTRRPVGSQGALYLPLADQDANSKGLALEYFGAEDIYISVEPSGYVMRLPVLPKLVNGRWRLSPKKRNPLRAEQQHLLGESQKLGDRFALFVITNLSDRLEPLLHLFAVSDQEAEVESLALWEEADRAVSADQGRLRQPDELLKRVRNLSAEEVEALRQKLLSGEITITSQTYDTVIQQTTFRRPAMKQLSALLAEGFSFEGAASAIPTAPILVAPAAADMKTPGKRKINLAPFQPVAARHWENLSPQADDPTTRRELLEKAESTHTSLVNTMGAFLASKGIDVQIDPSGKTLDLLANINGETFLFEMKSIRKDNVQAQTSEAKWQLDLYAFYLGQDLGPKSKITKIAVYNKNPFGLFGDPETMKQFLVQAGIHPVWLEDGVFCSLPESAAILQAVI